MGLRQCRGDVRRRRRFVGLDRWQIAVKTPYLHGRELSGAALRQSGGADIPCKDVGIAVNAKGSVLLRVDGVVPGAGRKLDAAAPKTEKFFPDGSIYRGESGKFLRPMSSAITPP
jgi:hypothetical protein